MRAVPDSPQELYEKMALDFTRDNMHNRELGRRGEKKAQKYLRKNGWRILETNYKNPFGEIDIIAKKGEVIAFVEVKTRLTDLFGSPSEAVGFSRQTKYIRGANYYFAGAEPDAVIRFDIIEVFKDRINHIENAFNA